MSGTSQRTSTRVPGLAGTNKLEILLFTLGTDPRTGRRETFGINVFKVREVMRTPPITAAPRCLRRSRAWSACGRAGAGGGSGQPMPG